MTISYLLVIFQILGITIFTRAILTLYRSAKYGEAPNMGRFMLSVTASMLLMTSGSIQYKDGQISLTGKEPVSLDLYIPSNNDNGKSITRDESMTIDSF